MLISMRTARVIAVICCFNVKEHFGFILTIVSLKCSFRNYAQKFFHANNKLHCARANYCLGNCHSLYHLISLKHNEMGFSKFVVPRKQKFSLKLSTQLMMLGCGIVLSFKHFACPKSKQLLFELLTKGLHDSQKFVRHSRNLFKFIQAQLC